MENTIENKAKFFAQHWGQRILFVNQYHEFPYEISSNHLYRGDYVNLKPLLAITDEDAIECIYLNWPDMRGEEVSIKQMEFIIHALIHRSSISDYLRSKGYALPWMGMIVEKMVEYGWIKLATDDK